MKSSRERALVLAIDGAQATPHMAVNVQTLNCDFYVSSGHKMFGPTGVGFLYGKKSLLESLDVYQGGGEMIAEVSFEKTTYADLPQDLRQEHQIFQEELHLVRL